MGYPDGMYRVGPLGRFNAAEGHSTPFANKEFQEARKMGKKRRFARLTIIITWPE